MIPRCSRGSPRPRCAETRRSHCSGPPRGAFPEHHSSTTPAPPPCRPAPRMRRRAPPELFGEETAALLSPKATHALLQLTAASFAPCRHGYRSLAHGLGPLTRTSIRDASRIVRDGRWESAIVHACPFSAHSRCAIAPLRRGRNGALAPQMGQVYQPGAAPFAAEPVELPGLGNEAQRLLPELFHGTGLGKSAVSLVGRRRLGPAVFPGDEANSSPEPGSGNRPLPANGGGTDRDSTSRGQGPAGGLGAPRRGGPGSEERALAI